VNTIAKCEGKYRQVIYCCDLTVAESAGTPQLILNLKRQLYPVSTAREHWQCGQTPVFTDVKNVSREHGCHFTRVVWTGVCNAFFNMARTRFTTPVHGYVFDNREHG